ncbi:EAL domain-containing protein [Alkalimarinus sediminis]|uniref:cyclic-guanylate-specific phosphodiesterase n=1 Tax=Alkalimarinus sediminis TaxID=1632866 RepID=A0A9E8HQC8_9ALTE|nr:EAL domain-containing protein [Alkalimarinus sediminis]UZW74606.1 EAL domain-containing protein [Alkalimarinus sediminis]
MSADILSGNTEMLPMVSRSDKSSFSVLLLTPEHTESLWIDHLLSSPIVSADYAIRWCSDLSQLHEQVSVEKFDVILWDCGFRDEDPMVFLGFLSFDSDHTPVVCISSEPEEILSKVIFQAGGADYLCKSHITPKVLDRSLRHAILRNAVEKQQTTKSHIDTLTGVVNRQVFFDRFHQSILRADRHEDVTGLLLLNVDDFSRVNERFGYQYGDQLIKRVASRLRQGLRKSDSLARIGGDEFAVILEHLDDSIDANHVAAKLLELFEQPFDLDHHQLMVTLSAGVAVFPDAGPDTESILKNANRAMQDAKRQQGNTIEFFHQKMSVAVERELALEAEFRAALRNGQLRLFYQPRVSIMHSQVVGYECLIRWQHPTRGLIMPEEFIPAAERSGMIVPMGYWVVEQACRDLAKLQTLGYDDLVCAVNLSFRQFYDKKLSETVFRIIYNANINTGNLEFELTESAMMYDQAYTQKCLKQLTQLGVSFSLDDFGTGYSSFANIQKLPISTIKIDKSFIEFATNNIDDQVIVKSIISLAHNLQINVVAEGVETEEQLAFLRLHHCDEAQGYLFSKAVPFDDFLTYLEISKTASIALADG